MLEGTSIPSVERPLPGPPSHPTGSLRLEVADGLAGMGEQGQAAMTQIAEPDRGRPARSSSGVKFRFTNLFEGWTEGSLNPLVTMGGIEREGAGDA